MKCLFCYDGPLEADSKGNFYGTVINDKVFARYKKIADEIYVAIRVVHTTKPNEKSLIKSENVTVYEVANISSVSGQLKKRKVIKNISELVKNVDFMIIRLPSFIGNECEKIARQENKPYIIEMVGCPWDSLWNYNIKGKFIAPLMWLQTRKKLKNSSYTIYVTNKFLQKRYPTNGKYVCCSNVEISDDTVINKKKLIRYDSLEKSDTLILGTSAAVDVPYKGQECVLRAIPILLKKGINVQYEMAGGGDQSHLRKIAEELGIEKNVIFKGLMPHEDVFTWLQQVDIYIQPSKQEGLPRALIEAMNSTCFCIGAHTGGIPELLSENMIFSNKKNNYIEIAMLIEKNWKNMAKEAEKNFRQSIQYGKSKIQNRRDIFLTQFSEERLK